MKYEKLNFRKSWGIYKISFENRTRMERSSRHFSCPQVIANYRQYLLFQSDILQKTVVGCPWYRSTSNLQRLWESLGRYKIRYEETKKSAERSFRVLSVFYLFQEFESCLASTIKAEPGPVPKVLNFYVLLVYQASYLYKRSNLCPKLTYEGVKTITEDSGKLGHNE